jgi:hypothetical protein
VWAYSEEGRAFFTSESYRLGGELSAFPLAAKVVRRVFDRLERRLSLLKIVFYQ